MRRKPSKLPSNIWNTKQIVAHFSRESLFIIIYTYIISSISISYHYLYLYHIYCIPYVFTSYQIIYHYLYLYAILRRVFVLAYFKGSDAVVQPSPGVKGTPLVRRVRQLWGSLCVIHSMVPKKIQQIKSNTRPGYVRHSELENDQ